MRRSNVDIERAKTLYESGMTLKEVGDAMGVSHTAIYHQFSLNGIETRPRGAHRKGVRCPQKIDFDRAVMLYQHGMTLQQVGDVFGCSKQAVQQLLRHHGIEREEGRRGPKPWKTA